MYKSLAVRALLILSHFSQIFYENEIRTSDTLIGYLPIFQMHPKTSLCIRYHWHPFEKDA